MYNNMNVNRAGLGLRPPMASYGQGPSMMALAQQQQAAKLAPDNAQPQGIPIFIGSIAGGITDAFLNDLFSVCTHCSVYYSCFFYGDDLLYFKACGPVVDFKRSMTPANKKQGFGFAHFRGVDGAARAIKLLDQLELPGMEDGAPSRKLVVCS